MIRKITEFILYSHIFIGLGAFALNYVCQIYMLGSWKDPRLSLFCFGACWFSYLFHRFNVYEKRDSSKDNEVMAWTKKHLLVLKSTFPIIGLALLYQFFQFNFNTQILLSCIGFISFTYSSSFFGFSLRNIPFLKIILISFNWTASTSLILLTEYSPPTLTVFYVGLHVFLLIFALTIPFDIRDLSYDKIDSLKTIPSHFGIISSKKLACGSILLWFIVVFILQAEGESFIVPLILIVPTLALIFNSEPEKDEKYFLGLVDGIIILWGIVIYIAQNYTQLV